MTPRINNLPTDMSNVVSLMPKLRERREQSGGAQIDPEIFIRAEELIAKLRHPTHQMFNAVRLPLPQESALNPHVVALIAEQNHAQPSEDPRAMSLGEQLTNLEVYLGDSGEVSFAYHNRQAKRGQIEPNFIAYRNSDLLWLDLAAEAREIQNTGLEWTALWGHIGQIANSDAFLPRS